MTTGLSPGVRRITLDADGLTLSALLCEPADTPPRAVVVALHGGGMRAGYFDGQAHPRLSLLALGASLGYTVLALDRPGYGASAAQLPEGQSLTEQSMTLQAALKDFTARYASGAGLFLLAHSYGGKLALTAAAGSDGAGLLGLDISGCGHKYAVEPDGFSTSGRHRKRHWGPLRLYPPNTFRTSGGLVAPLPECEQREAAHWPEIFADLASRVRTPLRLTFAEFEGWWRHDETAVADLTARLVAVPRVLAERQPDAGHNISLGWAARSYHLRALAFLEDCLAQREAASP
jgi:pimeloyl-ACP methyl ester carboxylesterase